MVEELDEKMFEEYLKEGGKWDKLKKEEKNKLMNQFRNWEFGSIEFWFFGDNFGKNMIEHKWVKIRVWGRYVYREWRYVFEEQVNTLIPKK